MPRSTVLAYVPRVPTLDQILELKRYWNVSAIALTRRLHDIGRVSEWQYRMLCIELQKRGYRGAEPNGIVRESSQILGKVFELLRAERVSKIELARQLQWPSQELDALIFGLAVTSVNPGNPDRGRKGYSRNRPHIA